MNPESIRIAIAEACGWTQCKPTVGDDDAIGLDPKTVTWELLPNYPTDLNAIHLAENVLTKGQKFLRNGFCDRLEEITGGAYTNAYFATAAQRAEAFLRTLSLWTD